MRIVVTGATGFVGSHVARALIRERHEVLATVRPGSDHSRIADIDAELHLLEHDLLTDDPYEIAALEPEICIHAAWYAEPGRYLASPLNLDLVSRSAQLALALGKRGCRRFVGIGTCFEYDVTFGSLSELTPTRPRHLYSAAKLASYLLLEQVSASTGMEAAWARLFYLHGPHEDPRRLVPSVVIALLRGEEVAVTPGEQIRDFLHVADVAGAIVAIADADVVGPVNVGSGIETTVKEVVEAIAAIVGGRGRVRLGAKAYPDDEPMRVVADNARLRTCGWSAQYDLRGGLTATVNWWRENASATGAHRPAPRPAQ